MLVTIAKSLAKGFGELFIFCLGILITFAIFFGLGYQNLWYVNSPGQQTLAKEDKTPVKVSLAKPKTVRPSQKQPRSDKSQQKPNPLLAGMNLSAMTSALGGSGRGAAWNVLEGPAQGGGGDGEGVEQDARPIMQSPPQFPEKARKNNVSGKVRILITVGIDGTVNDVKFLEVPAPGFGFEEAIMEAVKKWKYEPAMGGGVPVTQKIEQDFQF